MSPEVSAYLGGLDEPRHSIIVRLREILLVTWPELEEGFAWSRPVYRADGRMTCHLVANAKDVNLGFDQGAHLPDPTSSLKGTGANMRHLKFKSLSDVDESAVSAMVSAAKSHHLANL